MVEHELPIRGTTSDGEDVTVCEMPLSFLAQLAGWENFEASGATMLNTLGFILPADYRNTWRGKNAVVWRTSPDRVLVRSDNSLPFTSTADVAALDLSQAKILLRFSGPGSSGLLARLAAIDFSETSFPIGSFVQTGMHHIGVLIDRVEEQDFDVIIPTSWAASLVGYVGAHLHR